MTSWTWVSRSRNFYFLKSVRSIPSVSYLCYYKWKDTIVTGTKVKVEGKSPVQ